MTLKVAQYGPLIVGPLNSVFPAAHAALRDGRWRELVEEPVCIATFAQDEIGAESARLLAAGPELFAALRELAEYVEGQSDPDVFPEEARLLTAARAAIAKAEGR